MPAPEIIHQLVKTFDQNRDAYRSGKYNEAQLRQQFLDKFFTALGWDVGNTHGYPPENAEVIIEDSLEVEGTSKAPDYCFRLGHDRKFFVEAKKPAIDIKYDIHPAYQLRRYAWNAHLPLSILTDFEELSIYNTKAKPNPTDSPATCRDKYYHYTEYIEKWDEIAAIFSREAVWNGSFDKFAAESKGKKGTTEVDDDILATISEWRKSLAGNIALRNKPLIHDEAQLNYAVQMTIDRILFLRICEDRGIEPEDQLKSLAAAPAIYPRLVELFRRADTKYNSGLFHFSAEKHETSPADAFTPSLSIDDKVLKEIIKDIYYPCPYIFKEIPVEILGQVYEQFLGKVIHLTPAGLAKVEEKPEVRKAGGVYYTPTYIVEYIVENTVGELVKGKTPEQVSALKVVDPACGSGSFLLGAFAYLLDWHYQYYTTHDPESWAKKKNPPIYPLGGGWRLTTSEKKRILTNNLHGVDIDAQAVEVTKLSLLLKVLEEETGQLTLGFERVLPDLGKNIQCGNSLIGWDYFEGQLTIDEEERKRVNPFDWQRAFPQVFAQGGFDAVIGNPPYGAELSVREREYVKKYNISTSDTAALMMTRAFEIAKKEGYNGFIIPKPFLYSSVWDKTRNKFLDFIFIIGDVNRAWKEVLLEQVIYILQKGVSSANYCSLKSNGVSFKEVATYEKKDCTFFGFILNDLDLREVVIARKAWGNSKPLNEFVNNSRGGMFQDKVTNEENDFFVLGGKQISRYFLSGYKGYTTKNTLQIYPNSKLEPGSLLFQNIVAHVENPHPHIKIIGTITTVEQSSRYLILDTVNQLINFSKVSSLFLLGVLLSKFINWYTYRFVYAKAIRTMHFDATSTMKIPISDLNLEEKKQQIIHTKIIALVERMLDLHKLTPATPQEHEQLTREIAATDHQIDQLVYQLYGLTDDEIKIVESS